MRAIFISYRREDAEGQAGRLFADLAAHFGEAAVFMDVAGIEPGRDFRRVIDQHVSSCGVLLAMIGPRWIDAVDQHGKRRLDDPMDFVRLETASALKRDIPVVPVLVHGARMPKPEQLPGDLAELAYRNGVELTHARWDSDVQVLVKALAAHVATAPKAGVSTHTTSPSSASPAKQAVSAAPPAVALTQNKTVKLAVAGALAALAMGGGGYTWNSASSERAAVIRQAAMQAEADKQAAAEALAAKKQAEETAAAAGLEKKQAQEKAAAAELDKRLAQEKADADKREAWKRAQEKAVADKREAERQAQLRAEADRIAAEKQKLEADRLALWREQQAAAEALEAKRRAEAKAVADRLKVLAERERPSRLGACLQGYVWREAGAGDRVCVTPASRAQAASDNRLAPTRRQPGAGAYGANTCKQGYVWREAFAGDGVCVTPEVRAHTANENARASSRVMR